MLLLATWKSGFGRSRSYLCIHERGLQWSPSQIAAQNLSPMWAPSLSSGTRCLGRNFFCPLPSCPLVPSTLSLYSPPHFLYSVCPPCFLYLRQSLTSSKWSLIDLRFTVLPLPPKCWDYRCALPCHLDYPPPTCVCACVCALMIERLWHFYYILWGEEKEMSSFSIYSW